MASRRSKRAAAALASGLGLVAMTITYLTVPWEGRENRAYWDRIGRVWTICSGDTLNVKPGMVLSDKQCDAKTYERMERDYHQPLRRCVKGFDRMPISVQAALLDLSWNMGVGTVCKSTAARRARSGDYPGACEAVTWFNKGGRPRKVVPGLVHRRENGDARRMGEYELCMEGLK